MDALSHKDLPPAPTRARKNCIELYNITRVSYADALDLQLQLHAKCVAGEIFGALMLLEHDPVITKGVKTGPGNVLASSQILQNQGVELVDTDRGGDVTYHGPGQLVGYPIFPIRRMGGDLHAYLRTLEQSIIDVLDEYDLQGHRNGPAGVWVGDRKVCSIGVAIRKWVTYHGFALNIAPNMSHFNLINPCGLASSQLTSMKELLGDAPSMDSVKAACIRAFERNFDVKIHPAEEGSV